ncbi:peroxiredoxin-like [Ischnura elegans]|uniref:peroxiredoxin-like n=1 Tax=Ischnura elegans TaxID=197161 RepID=UPI001ED8722F|nr:peroxiredoxin-like [Ischnura elegans]
MAGIIRRVVAKALPSIKTISGSQYVRPISTSLNVMAPLVQQKAPDFDSIAVFKGEFKNVKLSDYRGKYLVLLFYPLDFTFVCPTELISFDSKVKELKELNTEVIGISTDSHFSHLAWLNLARKEGGLGGLEFPLVADFTKSISKAYDVLIESEGLALRGLFIIDPQGVVRQATVNDLPVGRSVDEVIRLIKAFQFVEKHGEVCPANWTPDSPTIKPDPVNSKKYFEKVN